MYCCLKDERYQGARCEYQCYACKLAYERGYDTYPLINMLDNPVQPNYPVPAMWHDVSIYPEMVVIWDYTNRQMIRFSKQ